MTAPDRPLAVLWQWAEDAPLRPAIAGTSRSLTYAQLKTSIVQAAESLRTRGVRPDDRVLIAAENNVACVVLLFAVQLLEAWPALINARIALGEFVAMQACTTPRLVIFAIEDAPAAAHLARAMDCEGSEQISGGEVIFGRAAAQVPSEPQTLSAVEQVGLLIFTSGTLGTPKAVMWSHAALSNLGRVLAASRQTSAGDIVHGVAPLSHIMGMANLMASIHAGATLHLVPRLKVEEVVRAIAQGTLTHLSFVPMVYTKLVEYIAAHSVDVSRHGLRYISCGGAPLDAGLKRKVESALGLRLVNAYGLTECAPGLRSRPDRDAVPECVGWPEAGVDVRLVDMEGSDATVGELWLRSATMMMGYYGDPAQTAEALRPGGWLATGDLARILGDGSVAIVGRKKEMIIRSGFNVYPAEVEAALNAIEQVLQSGVVGRTVADGNEEVVAFVQFRAGQSLTLQEIQSHLRASIAAYKCPSRIVILDSLPTGATGKIWKARLAQMAAQP